MDLSSGSAKGEFDDLPTYTYLPRYNRARATSNLPTYLPPTIASKKLPPQILHPPRPSPLLASPLPPPQQSFFFFTHKKKTVGK